MAVATKEVDSKYNTIGYYLPYIFAIVILFIIVNFAVKFLDNDNAKKQKQNLSFDFYGAKEGKQVIHDELTAEESSLRMKYLIAATLVKAATWIKAPYMFALYNRLHGFTREEISILYCVAQVTSLLLGPLIGSLCDILGRKKFCVLYNFILITQISLRLTGNTLLAFVAEFLTGICQVLIDTVFESWLNFEANILFENNEIGHKQKNSYLREIFTKAVSVDCFSSIFLTGISTYLYVSFTSFFINIRSNLTSLCLSICA